MTLTVYRICFVFCVIALYSKLEVRSTPLRGVTMRGFRLLHHAAFAQEGDGAGDVGI